MKLNFQERSELKIQSRIDPLELLRGSPGIPPEYSGRIEKIIFLCDTPLLVACAKASATEHGGEFHLFLES